MGRGYWSSLRRSDDSFPLVDSSQPSRSLSFLLTYLFRSLAPHFGFVRHLGRQFHILGKRSWIALRGGMASNVSLKCYFLPVTLDTSEKSFITNTFTAVVNALLSFITVCGNAFAIFTISKQPHTRQLPYNSLLCCLAFADFTVGIIAQPTLAIYKAMELTKAPFRSYCAARIVQSYFGWLTAGVSLHILCAISVDRYLALRLHMRYAAVVTFTRVLKLIIGLWLFTVFLGSVRFFVAAPIWLAAVWLILLANIVLILVSYCKVFQIIRRHRRQIQARDQLAQYFHGRSAVEVARHRRSAVTMMYVLGIFISCYLPFFATIFVERMQGYSTRVRIAYDLSATVVFLSSTLNPFLYCWRIRGIRRKVLEMFRLRIGLPTMGNSLKAKIPEWTHKKIASDFNASWHHNSVNFSLNNFMSIWKTITTVCFVTQNTLLQVHASSMVYSESLHSVVTIANSSIRCNIR